MNWQPYITAAVLAIVVGMPATLLSGWQDENENNDRSKRLIELPTELIVSGTTGTDVEGNEIQILDGEADLRKGMIEAATIAMVQHGAESKASPISRDFNQAKVKPGLVQWHSDFEAACTASQQSKKPVLLFQMMGNLDDRFC